MVGTPLLLLMLVVAADGPGPKLPIGKETTGVTGLPPQALSSSGASNPPSLILQPWHQVGNVVSIRQFTTNAFNHHHGMQAEERFGIGVDAGGQLVHKPIAIFIARYKWIVGENSPFHQ